MLGIKFKVPNTYDNVLFKIFSNIASQNGFWKLYEEEIIFPNNSFNLDNDIYSDADFREIISSKFYYPIFLNLQFYKQGSTTTLINNYCDFLNSDCELILFITDNVYVEIYSKNEKTLEKINENVVNNKFQNVININDDSMVRKKFSAYMM